MKEVDLKESILRFNCKAILIFDLQDGITYTSFLNRLFLARFNFSLVERKMITLVEAWRGAQDFIQATEIWAKDDFVRQDGWKRVGEDSDSQLNKCPRKDEERAGYFHTNPRNILMEIKDNSMLKRRGPFKLRKNWKTRISIVNTNDFWMLGTQRGPTWIRQPTTT